MRVSLKNSGNMVINAWYGPGNLKMKSKSGEKEHEYHVQADGHFFSDEEIARYIDGFASALCFLEHDGCSHVRLETRWCDDYTVDSYYLLVKVRENEAKI